MRNYGLDSATQKYIPPVQSLITFVTAAAGPVSVHFRVPTPDSRLRVKISVLFVPPAGIEMPDITAPGQTLWLYEVEDDMSGVSGRSLPCTNIEGTQAAPTAIAAVAPQLGYSREFVSAADAIEGVLTAGNPGVPGTWVVQARYQPESVRFTDSEWNELITKCNPQTLTGPRRL